SQEEKIQKPKEIIVPPLAVPVNLIVRKARQSLEGLKSPKPGQKNNLYYFGYGPVAFGGILILIFAMSALIKHLRPREKGAADIGESLFDVQFRLSTLQKSGNNSRETLIKTRNNLFRLLSIILGIPANLALAKTSVEMLESFREADFSENLTRNLKTCLQLLDKSIYDYEPEQDFSEIWAQINGFLAAPEISRRFKKKKKFLIF
ncbi:MAG: hypothetical protein Q8L57_00855, partial [bacterium]|nr:hypothetical protein [bacterium]